MLPLTPQRVEVFVAPDALRRNESGSVTGPLWLQLPAAGEQTAPSAFPGDGWSDFPVVALAWWLGRLARDTGGREAIERCQFMDGPSAFTVRRRRGDSLWTVAAPGHAAVVVDRHSFLDTILEAARAVLDACHRNGWAGPDTDDLARAIEQADAYRTA